MIIRYILPIFALSIVIAIHELGHLLTAKLFGVHVEVFSIGIGKKLITYTKNKTQYALSLIPLGGYCKLKGGDIQNPIEDNDSMDKTHPLKKILIYFAGPFFNFLLTFIILSTVYLLPVHHILPPTVLPVTEKNLPAAEAGIINGDKILSINNIPINSFDDIAKNLSSNKLDVIVERGQNIINLTVYPQTIEGKSFIGVYPYIPLTIIDTNKNSILKPNDKIIALNEENVDNYFSLINRSKELEKFDLTIIRDSLILKETLSIKDLQNITFIKKYSYTPFKAIYLGFTNTLDMLKRIATLLFDLSKSGQVTKNISSPLRLVYDIGNSIDSIYSISNLLVSIQTFLTIIASISLSLGFINLLPIPILDGGQILLNIISLFKGKPINKKIVYGYQTAGLIIVLLLFTFGLTNDIFYFGDL